jgi:hypothetical protein
MLVAAPGGVAGCGVSSANDGMSHLTVADLSAPPQPDHFTGEPRPVEATLRAQPNGCVTVTVDGVTRIPLWPPDTSVEVDADHPDTYAVTISDGPTLRATAGDGDTLAALGVIDDGGPRFAPEGQPDDGKIASFLGFCDIDAAPIAFFDAASITRAGS